MRKASRDVPGMVLPAEVRTEIERAGYYPALVADVVGAAVGAASVEAYLVHQETTFDQDSVRRHITVLVMTPATLVVVHADDHDDHDHAVATATSETIPLAAVRGVMVTHVVASPDAYVPGTLGREITLTLGWGTVSRVDVMPASCGDPQCDAEHGFEGSISADDISLRISAAADGQPALARAIHFARTLSATIGR
ncbi:MAG: phosphodiesterase [Dermatophilaceae bacterium]|nr:phosphodiesterase [Dermatophilaceae bacterium]MBP9917627.1 phosphodiesterase [Dermatophilaceae bacterium]